MKILIVDDSSEMRRCIREMVSPGHEFIECSNGHDAVAAFAAHRPDWVLMDIQMPVQDGISAAQKIRADFPEARIVFVTSFDERRLRAAASQLGQGYVLKDKLEQINQIIYENPKRPNQGDPHGPGSLPVAGSRTTRHGEQRGLA